MNKLTSFILLIMLCTSNLQTQNMAKNTASSNFVLKSTETPKELIINDSLYTLQIGIEKSVENTYKLVLSMKLYKGSYFISPLTKKSFSGTFSYDLGSYKNLVFEGEVSEIPISIERSGPFPFQNELSRWINVNTTYKQDLRLNTQADFEVFGRVRFTIEPRCTYETIPFRIVYKNGIMRVLDVKC